MIQHLSQAGALTAGSKIWVLPDRSHSEWAQFLDWYLNFQMMRAEGRQPRQLDEAFKATAKKWEFALDEPVVTSEDASLLIAARQLLPCELVLQIAYTQEKGVSDWVEKIVRHRRALKADTIRVFLPKSVDLKTFEQAWNEPGAVGVLTDKDPEA